MYELVCGEIYFAGGNYKNGAVFKDRIAYWQAWNGET